MIQLQRYNKASKYHNTKTGRLLIDLFSYKAKDNNSLPADVSRQQNKGWIIP